MKRHRRGLKRALRAFKAFRKEYGVSPTARDMADAMGLTSSSTGGRWLRNLEQAGMIQRALPEGSSRPWVLTPRGRWTK